MVSGWWWIKSLRDLFDPMETTGVFQAFQAIYIKEIREDFYLNQALITGHSGSELSHRDNSEFASLVIHPVQQPIGVLVGLPAPFFQQRLQAAGGFGVVQQVFEPGGIVAAALGQHLVGEFPQRLAPAVAAAHAVGGGVHAVGMGLTGLAVVSKSSG